MILLKMWAADYLKSTLMGGNGQDVSVLSARHGFNTILKHVTVTLVPDAGSGGKIFRNCPVFSHIISTNSIAMPNYLFWREESSHLSRSLWPHSRKCCNNLKVMRFAAHRSTASLRSWLAFSCRSKTFGLHAVEATGYCPFLAGMKHSPLRESCYHNLFFLKKIPSYRKGL